MLSNYADRVRFVRALTKLSREKFEKKYGVNRSALKSWELGINTLTEKSAKLISNAINQEGYSCTPEWLIFGLGSEPRPLNQDEDVELSEEINQQAKIIYEADYFKKNNNHSIVCMVTDNSMFPNYRIGDYVGGIYISDPNIFSKLIGLLCIVSLQNRIVLIRKLLLGKNDKYILYPVNNQFESDVIKKEEIFSIAQIIWHRAVICKFNWN